MAEPLLSFKNVRAGYGEAVVLDDISFEMPERGSLAVLGRNGVGKSTLLLTLMGFTQLRRGAIVWRGTDITRLAPHRRAQSGIGWVAQEREIFANLSVEENLTVASRPGRWDLGAVFELFPRLKERQQSKGNQLSGGEQQMLATARALMTNPALLLLDEPLEGLAPIIVEELVRGLAQDDHRGRHRGDPGRAARRDRAVAHRERAAAGARRHRAPRPLGGSAEGPRHARPLHRAARDRRRRGEALAARAAHSSAASPRHREDGVACTTKRSASPHASRDARFARA